MEAMLATAPREVADKLGPWLEDNWHDLKQSDAIEALRLAAPDAHGQPLEPLLRPYELIHTNVGIEYFQSERLKSITARSNEREVALASFAAGIDVADRKYRDFLRARRYQRLIVGWGRELRLEPGPPAVATPDQGWPCLDAARRRATGMTSIDAARERRDAQFRAAMVARFCSGASDKLLAGLDSALAAEPPAPGFNTDALIVLDGRLVLTLWALGRCKGLTQSLSGDDESVTTDASADVYPNTADVMAFVKAVDDVGMTRFGYGFNAAREILIAHQALDRLDTIFPNLEVEAAA
jgi:hypothetical protein